MVGAVGTALVLFVGGYGALNGWWSLGVLVVVTQYLKSMFSPMKSLAKLAPSFTQGAASASGSSTSSTNPRTTRAPRALPARVARPHRAARGQQYVIALLFFLFGPLHVCVFEGFVALNC